MTCKAARFILILSESLWARAGFDSWQSACRSSIADLQLVEDAGMARVGPGQRLLPLKPPALRALRAAAVAGLGPVAPVAEKTPATCLGFGHTRALLASLTLAELSHCT